MPEGPDQESAFDALWALSGKRTIEKLHAFLLERDGEAPSIRTLYGWRSRYRWGDRIARLERQAREKRDEAKVAELEAMLERHATLAVMLETKVAELLPDIDIDSVTLEGLARALDLAIKLERLARGEPSDRMEIQGEGSGFEPFERFDKEELRRFAEESARLLDGARDEEPE